MRNIVLGRIASFNLRHTRCCIRTSASWTFSPVHQFKSSQICATPPWNTRANQKLFRELAYPSSASLQRVACFSTTERLPEDSKENDEKSLSIFQRFKQVYKEYGKILVGVHVVTSIAWYGMFYAIAYSGIDLLPLIIQLGASEALQAKFATAGDFLVAYILYEIAKPVRYLFTLFGTQQTVKLAKKRGYLPEVKPEDKLRSLARESRVKLKTSFDEKRDDLKEKYQEQRSDLKDKWDLRKQKLRSQSQDKHRNEQKAKHSKSIKNKDST